MISQEDGTSFLRRRSAAQTMTRSSLGTKVTSSLAWN
jgi:hypothetical protein